jgi:hypothetical protein
MRKDSRLLPKGKSNECGAIGLIHASHNPIVLTKFYIMKTYAVVKNPYGGVKVWHKNGRAKWYTNINHEDLESYIAKLVAQGYTKFQP